MTYEEAVSYLEEQQSFGIKPGLDRIQAICEALSHPEASYKTIHVTGTNGKGSVTAYLESVMTCSGLRVGRFTSPHLESYTERIRVNQRNITPEAFGALIGSIRDVVEPLVAAGMEPPTQFELLTAAAFLFFREQGVSYAIIEVGLGGLLDSTNVITPVCSVITNVTIDHTAYCGNTVEEIAKHKAGIIKEGVPVVTAAQGAPLDLIRETAKSHHAPLYAFNEAFTIESRSAMKTGQMVTWKEKDGDSSLLFSGMHGIHQTVNMACAMMALRLLMKQEPAITEEMIREGLARATWPGRFEIRQVRGRTVILDGAHNAGGAESFQMTYLELFEQQPKTLVMAILQDKEVGEIVGQIVGPHDHVITVPAPTPRSMDPEKLAKSMPCQAVAMKTVSEGLAEAFRETKEGDIIVVCGSLYILGEAMQWLRNQEN